MGFRYIISVGIVLLAFVVISAYPALSDASNSYVDVQQKAGLPEKCKCTGKGKCYQKVLTCPTNCPSKKGNHDSLCNVDCNLCTTTCKHPKPTCGGYGAVCYDPRFIGGDGVMFYFHGKKDQNFCLVSDRNLHINAHFIGKRPEGRTRDYTWVQSLGIMFDSHSLRLGAKKVSEWNENVDQLVFSFDGEDFTISEDAGNFWTSASGDVVVERTATTNTVNVVVKELMEAAVSVVAITEEENRVHNYQITKEDCFAHLQIQFTFFNLSPAVNGVLGQTYQAGFVNPVKRGVPMPIMGGDEKYWTSSLMAADCRVKQFMEGEREGAMLQLPSSLKCGTGIGGGMVCRR